MTHSPGMRPLCKDGILQISRLPLELPKTKDEESPEEMPQETTDATTQETTEQVATQQPQATPMQNPYLGYAPPNTPFFQQGGFAQPSENSENQAAAATPSWDGTAQTPTWDPSNAWD